MTVQPRDDVALMDGYHSPQVEVAVRLNTNEAPDAPPAAWVDAVAEAAAKVDWNRYPDRDALELRESIGRLHEVGAEQIFPANGSNEVLQSLLLAYGGPGRQAAVWEPTYALHSHIAKVVGTTVVVGERDEAFEITDVEIDRIFDRHRPSVAFLCSPNNPTGVVEPESVVKRVLELARERDCLVVVDEAYGQFAPWSATELIADDTPLVVTRTFSKTWSMAAERLGYLVGPSWVIDQLFKVVLPYHLDALKQAAGVLALQHVDEMEERVGRLVEERGRLVSRLQTLDVDVWPSGANFVLFRPRRKDGGAVWNDLLDHSVLVRNCSSWPRLDGCLRVTIGTESEDDAFLAALESALG